MSQATHITLPDAGARPGDRLWGLTLTAWLQIGIVTALMCALFRFNLDRLWSKTNPINGQDSNWQHSVFVPLIGLYYLYIHREELLRAAAAPVRAERSIRILSAIALVVLTGLFIVLTQGEDVAAFSVLFALAGVMAAGFIVSAIYPFASVFGLVVMISGLLVFAYGIFPGQNDYLKDLGMVIALFGVTTLLAGWPVMKVAWFPIVFLVVGLPWPELVYSKLAWPLQKMAASAAVGSLRLFGVEAQNTGTKIIMTSTDGQPRTLNVAEACAGLRSLMTFLMVGGTVAFLSTRSLWEKLAISISAVPIAILCNVVRVAGQGLLDYYVSKELSENFAHQFVGLIMLIPGFFLILLVGWVLDKLFVEEVDPAKLKNGSGRRGKAERLIVEIPLRSEDAEAASTQTSPAESGTTGSSVDDHQEDTGGRAVSPAAPQIQPTASRTAASAPPAVARTQPHAAPAPQKAAARPAAAPLPSGLRPPARAPLPPAALKRPASSSPAPAGARPAPAAAPRSAAPASPVKTPAAPQRQPAPKSPAPAQSAAPNSPPAKPAPPAAPRHQPGAIEIKPDQAGGDQ